MKKPVKHPAQAKYQAAKAGEYVQINVKFKSKEDVRMFEKLRERFEGETDSGIARIAIKKLAKARN